MAPIGPLSKTALFQQEGAGGIKIQPTLNILLYEFSHF